MEFAQHAVLIGEGAVCQRVHAAGQQLVFRIDGLGIVGGLDGVQLVHRGAEDVVVLPAGLLDDFHVRAVEGAQGHRAVEHQLHVAGAAGFGAGGGNLLADVRGGDDFFRPGAVVVLHEHHLQPVAGRGVGVHHVRNHVDEVDDGLGPVIARGGLRAEDKGGGGEVRQPAVLEKEVDGKNAQGVHQLALVLVQALHLHVEHHVGGEGHTLPAGDFRRQLALLLALDADKIPAQRIVDEGLQLLQAVQVGEEPVADLPGDQGGQLGVAQAQPAPLGDAVGLVLEALGIQGVPVGKHVVLEDFGV